jgi:hypothetical protein
VSLIDFNPKDLLYLSLKNAALQYEKTDTSRTFAFSLDHYQLDNQLYESEVPVFICQKKNIQNFGGQHKRKDDESTQQQPLDLRLLPKVSFNLAYEMSKSSKFMTINLFELKIPEIFIMFEGIFLFHLLMFVSKFRDLTLSLVYTPLSPA